MRNAGGRPKIAYSQEIAEQVRELRQYGGSLEDIALAVGISAPTLRKQYAAELERGVALANIAVGRKLYERCMAGDPVALFYWTKARMGWREKDKQENKNMNQEHAKQITAAIANAMRSVGE